MNSFNDMNGEKYDFQVNHENIFDSQKEKLSEELIKSISAMKKEPLWMLEKRLEAFKHYQEKPLPWWGDTSILQQIDDNQIHYYVKPVDKVQTSWKNLSEGIQETFDRIGLADAEKKYLGGVSAQFESEVVYHSLREDLENQNVIFLDMDSALKKYPELVQKYFGTIISSSDNKYAALNGAVWSGGSFIYVPKGVHIEIPLQAYFRINIEQMGQFERTLIIADEGSSIHYIEGCTAPRYSTHSLHAAVVELIALKGAHIRYTTIQNWAKNIYNLVTKRAIAYENAHIEWIDGNIGSLFTMKYPAIVLAGEGAQGKVLSVAFAGKNQKQDSGAKIIHAASHTTSHVTAKSVSQEGGVSLYRGLVKVLKDLKGCQSHVRCDGLLLDEISTSDTLPSMDIRSYEDTSIGHEASVSRVSEEQISYLKSRGFSESQATLMIVNGFLDEFARELPMEYALELNKLIQLEME